jgi:hypothetical protein
MNTTDDETKPSASRLPSKPGVYRCKLWPVTNKKKPEHADAWVHHQDGTLGLRVCMASGGARRTLEGLRSSGNERPFFRGFSFPSFWKRNWKRTGNERLTTL